MLSFVRHARVGPDRPVQPTKWLAAAILLLLPLGGALEKQWCPVVSTVDSQGYTDFVQSCSIYVKSRGRWLTFLRPT